MWVWCTKEGKAVEVMWGAGAGGRHSEMTFLRRREPECSHAIGKKGISQNGLCALDAWLAGRLLPQLCGVAHPRAVLFSCIYQVTTGPC